MPVINVVVYSLLSFSCWEESSKRWTGLNLSITCSATDIRSPLCGRREERGDCWWTAPRSWWWDSCKGCFPWFTSLLVFPVQSYREAWRLCRTGLLMFHPLNVWKVQWFLNSFVPLCHLISKVCWPTDKCEVLRTGNSKIDIHSFMLCGHVPIKLKSRAMPLSSICRLLSFVFPRIHESRNCMTGRCIVSWPNST